MSIEDRVRRTLHRRAEATEPSEELWARISTPPHRRTSAGRSAALTVAAIGLAGASFWFLTRSFGTDADPPAERSEVLTVHEFPIGPNPGRLIASSDAVWVSRPGGVTRFDPATGEVTRIEVHLEEPGPYGSVGEVAPDSGLAFGNGLVWVTAEPYFAGVDPVTNEIADSILFESGVTNISFDGRWLLYGGSAEGIGQLVLLDPDDTHRFSSISTGTEAGPIPLATTDWFWAGGEPAGGRSGLSRESRDGTRTEAIDGVTAVDSMIEVDGSVWAAGDGKLWRIDAEYEGAPASPQSTFPEMVHDAILGSSPIGDPALLATGGGRVWSLSDHDGDRGTPPVLQEHDPGNGELLGDPIEMPYTGSAQLAAGPDGYPWITFADHGALIAVRPTASVSDPDQSPTPSPSYLSPGERWAPSTYTEGDRTVMPVTFPDGTTAELVYPAELELEAMSVYPDTFVEGGPAACGWTVHATRYDPLVGWTRGDAPLARHVTRDGSVVALWEGTLDNEPYNYLVYRSGAWSVLVPCRSDGPIDGGMETLAENLHGFETPEGLLVLEGTGPLILHPWRDQHGPALRLSDEHVVIDLRPLSDQCDPASGWGGDTNAAGDGTVQWCIQPEGRVYLYANGFTPEGKEYLQRLVNDLEVRVVVPGT